ncbi:hypothetical protein KBD81_04775 [Candidatus Woesebacteria bacterium]|nr:hypothetical protein [Candidatus Woesebacteria bacterium]
MTESKTGNHEHGEVLERLDRIFDNLIQDTQVVSQPNQHQEYNTLLDIAKKYVRFDAFNSNIAYRTYGENPYRIVEDKYSTPSLDESIDPNSAYCHIYRIGNVFGSYQVVRLHDLQTFNQEQQEMQLINMIGIQALITNPVGRVHANMVVFPDLPGQLLLWNGRREMQTQNGIIAFPYLWTEPLSNDSVPDTDRFQHIHGGPKDHNSWRNIPNRNLIFRPIPLSIENDELRFQFSPESNTLSFAELLQHGTPDIF